MEIQRLIEKLKSAKGPERGLDGQVAQVLGWRKIVEPTLDPKTGERKNRTLWRVPAGDDFGRIPYYTGSFDAARALVEALAPGKAVACSWDNDSGKCVIEGGTTETAASPVLAICVAALVHRNTKITSGR